LKIESKIFTSILAFGVQNVFLIHSNSDLVINRDPRNNNYDEEEDGEGDEEVEVPIEHMSNRSKRKKRKFSSFIFNDLIIQSFFVSME